MAIQQTPPAILSAGLPLIKPRAASKHLKVLVYGDPGTGKTHLAGTAEDVTEMRDVLYCDTEKGTLTLATAITPSGQKGRGEFLDIFQMETFAQAAEALIDFLRYENQGRYRTVVVDSLSSLYSMAQRETEQRLRQRSSSGMANGLQVIGETSIAMETFLKALYDLPISIVCTCHAKDQKDPRDGSVKIQPTLPGWLATGVARYFDLIGYLYVAATFKANSTEIESTHRRLITEAHFKYLSKNRYGGAIDANLIEPNMQMLWDAAYGEV